MRVVTVCTGNVARSVALAILLGDLRPDLDISSAAVGKKAKPGRRAARPMRRLLAEAGHRLDGETHRSSLYMELGERPDLVIACAPVHLRRLEEIDPDVTVQLCHPPIPDPAFGGEEAYLKVWPLLVRNAHHFAATLPGAA